MFPSRVKVFRHEASHSQHAAVHMARGRLASGDSEMKRSEISGNIRGGLFEC